MSEREDKEDDFASIERKKSRSEKVDYGDPIVLHETSRTRVKLVPFFIKRTEGTSTSVKVITERKIKWPHDWAVVEEKSMTLNEPAGRQLLKGLKNVFAVAQEDEEGEYVVIRIGDGSAELSDQDPAKVAGAVAKVLNRKEISKHLVDAELGDELVQALRGAIRLKEMRSAVAKLRALLDSGTADESAYQKWCEEHTWAFWECLRYAG